jgi:hypothetical protein
MNACGQRGANRVLAVVANWLGCLHHQRTSKKIGLETNHTVELNIAPVSGEPARSRRKGVFGMIIFLIAAAGTALALQQPRNSDLPDPMTGSALDEREPRDVLAQIRAQQDPDRALAPEGMNALLRRLHSKVRSEPRDDKWSPQMEAPLRRFFLQVPSVRSSPHHLRVICSATLCEVTANLPKRQSADGQLYLPEFQDPKQEAELQQLGLEPLPKVLGSTSAGPLYLSYWGRISKSQ